MKTPTECADIAELLLFEYAGKCEAKDFASSLKILEILISKSALTIVEFNGYEKTQDVLDRTSTLQCDHDEAVHEVQPQSSLGAQPDDGRRA